MGGISLDVGKVSILGRFNLGRLGRMDRVGCLGRLVRLCRLGSPLAGWVGGADKIDQPGRLGRWGCQIVYSLTGEIGWSGSMFSIGSHRQTAGQSMWFGCRLNRLGQAR